MLQRIIFATLFLIINSLNTQAKQDSLLATFPQAKHVLEDSTSSVQNATIDTIAPKLVRKIDSLEQVRFQMNPSNRFGYPIFSLKDWLSQIKLPAHELTYQAGTPLAKGIIWPLFILVALVALLTLYKNVFRNQLWLIIRSFYSNRALTQLNKEEKPTSSWALISLFILLSFTSGLFIFYLFFNQQLNSGLQSFKTYLNISLLLMLFFLLKVIFLNLFGFLFELMQPCKEYVTSLYMTFYNISLLYLPLVIIVTLQPNFDHDVLKLIGIILIPSLFIIQFIRMLVGFMSQYKFSKLYLFLYLCAFEICPILILIKVLGLNSAI
jgi:hypothetical protein